MLGMSDITTVFGPTQTSTVEDYTASGDGVGLLVNWDDTGEGFTRVVFQRENVDADWSAYENFYRHVPAIRREYRREALRPNGRRIRIRGNRLH